MHKHDTWIGISSGIFGGFVKYSSIALLQISFSQKLIESAVIAIVCGACGVIGKELIIFLKKKFFKAKSNKDVGES